MGVRIPDMTDNRLAARIAGAILVAISLLLLGFTERADRLRAMGEDALGGFVLSGNEAQPGAASDGRLVFVSGATQIAQPARDTQFGVSADAVAIVRKVEMFQWRPLGGTQNNYEQDWIDHPVDSTKFAQQAGHENPGAFPFAAQRFDSTDVRVGGFRLGPELVRDIEGLEDFSPDLHALAPNMAATFQAAGDALVTSADPARPRIGDIRVSWMQILPTYLSVLARAQNGVLVRTQDATGRDMAQVQIGKRSLSDVVPDAAPRPRFAWAKRALAVLLAWAGVALLIRPMRKDGLALLVAAAPLALLASLFWFGVRNIAGGCLMSIALLAAAGACWLAKTQRSRSAEAAQGEDR